MLVLSSATRSLGTINLWRRASGLAHRPLRPYCSTPGQAGQRRRRSVLLQLLAGGKRGVYQGTSLWRPFFFLLVDSFLSSSLLALLCAAAAGCPAGAAAGVEPVGLCDELSWPR